MAQAATDRRILITGGVNTGKSLLSVELGRALEVPVRFTDELLGGPGARTKARWEEVTLCVVGWLREPGPWVISGVRVPYALLRFNLLYPDDPFPSKVVYLTRALSRMTPEQEALTKAIDRVWAKVEEIMRVRPLYRGPYRPTLIEEIMRQ